MLRFLSGADRLMLDQHPVCDFAGRLLGIRAKSKSSISHSWAITQLRMLACKVVAISVLYSIAFNQT